MTRLSVLAFLWLASTCPTLSSDGLLQGGISKFLGTLTTIKNVRTSELLNQLCMRSQDDVPISTDACFGCFYRATNQPTGYPLLLALSACADTYLNNTDYGHCQAYLRNATSNLNLRTSATTIYCTFLECIRQVNKDNLLRECIGEAVRMFPSFNRSDVQLAQLFVNTTACVLAKTRCGVTNPITGEYQEDDIASKLHTPSINAILVNTDYDINIVQLPYRLGGAVDVCAKYRNVDQASWPTVVC